MATQIEPKELDLQEQLVRIRRAVEESEKFSAETRKIVAEMIKAQTDVKFQPWVILFQGALASAALVGSGIAIAKFVLP